MNKLEEVSENKIKQANKQQQWKPKRLQAWLKAYGCYWCFQQMFVKLKRFWFYAGDAGWPLSGQEEGWQDPGVNLATRKDSPSGRPEAHHLLVHPSLAHTNVGLRMQQVKHPAGLVTCRFKEATDFRIERDCRSHRISSRDAQSNSVAFTS